MATVSSGNLEIFEDLTVSGGDNHADADIGFSTGDILSAESMTLDVSALTLAVQEQTIIMQDGFVSIAIVGGLLIGICLMLGFALGMRRG